MTKNVVELNGLKYDALTGKPLTVPKPTLNAAPKHLDGFSKRRAPSTPVTAVHKKTEKSKTLMRTVVKKPKVAKITAKASAAAAAAATPRKGNLIEVHKPGRGIRAQTIAQSNKISKFGAAKPTIKAEIIPVKVAPSGIKSPAIKQYNPTKPRHTDFAPIKAATNAPKPKAVAVKPKDEAAHSSGLVPHASPEIANPLHQAMENARVHAEPVLKKVLPHHKIANKLQVSPRVVSFSGIAMAAVIVSTFLAYQNLPELTMRVAATRAGLNASLPAYQPAGFSLAGPVEHQPGEVILNYKSHSDERAFNVTQKNSSWNSETLLENFVATTKQPYQTFQANGRTIYIYEGNKATWVDGGVWYNIDGQSSLNSDQLLRIADSL